MIYDAGSLPTPATLKADLCVVGSGAGGAMVAMLAAEAGMKVIVLEAGPFLTPADMVQREEAMFPRLYWEGGGRTTQDRGIKVHQGRGVGGSTLHNLNLCKRIPRTLLERWQRERGLATLPLVQWDALYAEVEALLSVSEVPRAMVSPHNQMLERACAALGWRGGPLRHNRSGCIGSGFCEVGCAYDAKNNAAKVLLPRALKAGATVLTRCQAAHVDQAQGHVTSVGAYAIHAQTHEPIGAVNVKARAVCLSASATATAAILLRSRVADPSGETGKRLRLHPAVVTAGDFDEPMRAWEGIPQTYECTEHLEFEREGAHRTWIVPAFAHPMGTATMMPGLGAGHRSLMLRYPHLGVLTGMVHDGSAGSVEPHGDLGLRIDYWPDEADRRELAFGLWATGKLLFAGGARRVLVATRVPRVYARPEDLDELLQMDLVRGDLDITSVHPMGSVPMGDDPQKSAVSSEGKHHHVEGLWVADGSLFPSSIGVPPQLSIYALGMHVGRSIAAR